MKWFVIFYMFNGFMNKYRLRAKCREDAILKFKQAFFADKIIAVFEEGKDAKTC